MPDPDDTKKPKSEGDESFAKELARDVTKGLLEESRTTIKWGLWGALIGGLTLGGIGLAKFPLEIAGIAALIGAVLGGLFAAFFYLKI